MIVKIIERSLHNRLLVQLLSSAIAIDDIIRRLDSAVQLPGLTNAWGYPIRTLPKLKL